MFKKNPPIIKHNPKIKTATTLNLPLIEFSLNKMKQVFVFKCFTWVFSVQKMLRDVGISTGEESANRIYFLGLLVFLVVEFISLKSFFFFFFFYHFVAQKLSLFDIFYYLIYTFL
jgi:hypothetical protein